MARAHSRLAPDQLWSAATAPRVHLQTLGACQIQVGIERLSPASETLFSLLLRLVYAPGMQMTREALLPAIWPDQPERRQRANLRQALYKLRRMGVLMELSGDEVRFDARQVSRTFATERSVERFERDVIAGHEPFGTFLPGFSPRGAELREWMYQYREVVHADVRRVLVTQLRARRERADWHGAETLGRWLLQFDPLNEEATLTMAECAALSGGKAQAVSIIDSYLHELGPDAGEIRLPATTLRRRIVDHGPRKGTIASPERHFVGREAELTELTLALRRARWHDSSAYLLHGPPGMGKTRLTQELAKVAALEGMLQLRFACRESDSMRQLSLVLELVSELLGSPGALGCAPETLTHLRRLVGEEPVPVSAEGVPLPREPLPGPAAVRRGVIDLLAAVGEEKPVFLVIDDVHWLDVQSWDVLAQLIEQSKKARVCLLATSREAHPCAQRPESIPERLQVLKLGPLSDEQSRALTKAIAEDMVVEVEEGVRSQIVHLSQGSPLFLRSLVGHWIHSRSLRELPWTISDVIARRLAALSPLGQRVVQVIALMGEEATPGMVQDVLQIPAYTCSTAFDEIARDHLIDIDDEGILSCHELISQSALQYLSLPSRRLIHLRIANVLLGQDPSDSARVLQALSHLKHAGDESRLTALGLDHVQALANRGESQRVLQALEVLFHLLPEQKENLQLQSTHRDMLFLSGRHSQLLECLPERSHDASWDVENPEHALRIIWSTSYNYRSALRDFAARALAIAESPSVDCLVRIQAAAMAIKLSSDANASDIAKRAYDLSRVVLSPDESLQSGLIEVYYHTIFGDRRISRGSALRLVDRVESVNNQQERLNIRQDLAYALRFSGEPAIAEQLYRENHDLAARLGAHTAAALSAYNLSLMALDWRSDLRQASHWAERLFRVGATSPEKAIRVVVTFHQVRMAIESGDADTALSAMAAAREAHPSAENSERQRLYCVALELGIAALQDDRTATARHFSEALERYDSHKDRPANDFFLAQLICAALRLKERVIASTIALEYTGNRSDLSPPPHYLARAIESALTG